jgi:7,8-dihydropterin-6-yl-methyl-4-(beta-D-ribofuranosyl)aminobenzene 5'-phosphate synthase
MTSKLKAVDRTEVIVLVDNVVDSSGGANVKEAQPASQWVNGLDHIYTWAGHGLSLLVRTYIGDEKHEIIYDAGPSNEILEHNVKLLDVNLSPVEGIVMSHGHWDHFGGLEWTLKKIGKKSIPVYLHPRMLAPRRTVRHTDEGTKVVDFPDIITEEQIESLGGAPVKSNKPITLAGDTLLRTGEVPRITEYEKGMPGHEMQVEGKWVNDVEVVDDCGLIINVEEKGLVVLTGCAHAGVVNSVGEAIRLTGTDDVYAIIGGIHLMRASEMVIENTVRDLKEFDPRVIACGHCTGWRAQHAMSREFGKRYVQNSVGTMFAL